MPPTPVHVDARRPPTRRRATGWLAGAALFVGFAPSAVVAGGSARPVPETAPRDMRAWLMRIHEAARQRNFQGTFVVTAGGLSSSARIAHYVDGAHQFERSETLDGERREVFRRDQDVVTAWPGTHLATVERRLVAQFPALLKSGDDRIADHYELTVQGAERVAGRDADVLLVWPRDTLRYGYRMWSDRQTGLLLRLDTLGEKKEVLESSAFSDVSIDVKPRPESVVQPMMQLAGYQVQRPTYVPVRLEDEGWTVRELAGFRLVSCVRRPASEGGSDERATLQTIHSDGLTYVSLFVEPFDARRHRTPMQTAVGATQTLMLRQGDWWVTSVGDVPPATLRLFAQGLERRR